MISRPDVPSAEGVFLAVGLIGFGDVVTFARCHHVPGS